MLIMSLLTNCHLNGISEYLVLYNLTEENVIYDNFCQGKKPLGKVHKNNSIISINAYVNNACMN